MIFENYVGPTLASSLVFLATIGMQDVIGWDEAAAPPGVGLVLVDLEYEDGFVRQHVEPFGAKVMDGDWSAQIVREGEILCSGQGGAPYDGDIKFMTPTIWTDDKCPELKPGDEGIATWRWITDGGEFRRISGGFVVP